MDDLIGEFISATSDSLAVLDSELMALEHTPGDTAVLGNIYQLVHTIKGTCGFLGLPRLEAVAASGERLLTTMRESRTAVAPEALSLLLETLGRIKGLVTYLGEHGTEPDGDDIVLIRHLDQFLPGASPAKIEAAPAPEPTPEPEPVAVVEPAPEPVLPKAVEPVVAPEPAAAALTPKVKQDAIRHGLDTQATPPGMRERLQHLTAELVTTRNALAEQIRHRDEPELRALLQRITDVAKGLHKEIGVVDPAMAITPVLMVEAGGLRFALPQEAIVELLRIDGASEYASSAHVMRLRGTLLPLLPLGTALKLPDSSTGKDYVAVLRAGGAEFGIVVDRLYDLEELVVNALSGVLARIPLYRGMAVLGNGQIVLALEPEGLARVLGVAMATTEAAA